MSRRLIGGGLVLAVVLAAGVAVVAARGDDPVVVATHTWLEDAPVVDRGGAAVVWTGGEYVVAGGETDLLDRVTESDGAVGMSGSIEMNADGTTTDRGERDVHALDPTTRTWRQLPDLPFAVAGGTALRAGDATVVIDWRDIAVLRDGADRWTSLPRLDEGLGMASRVVGLAGHVVHQRSTGGDAVVVDLATGAQERLRSAEDDDLVQDLLVHDGDLLVLRDDHADRGGAREHVWRVLRVDRAGLEAVVDGAGTLDDVGAVVAEAPGQALSAGARLVAAHDGVMIVADAGAGRLELFDLGSLPAGAAVASPERRITTGTGEGPFGEAFGSWLPVDVTTVGPWVVAPLQHTAIRLQGEPAAGRVAHEFGASPSLGTTVNTVVAVGPDGAGLVVRGGGPPSLVTWSDASDG